MDPDRGLKLIAWGVVGLFVAVVLPYFCYTECRIEVPSRQMAVLMKKTGKNVENGDAIAPSPEYKGIQKDVLTEGRYFYNPYVWDWEVVPQIEIPEGKLGVRTRLYGQDLPPGDLIAWKENQKGILPQVLTPGRYAINARFYSDEKRYSDNYAEIIQLYDPVTIPAGFLGVVTELSAPLGKPNELLSEKGARGVQKETLQPGTYYINPFVKTISVIDCRSQRYNLSAKGGEKSDGEIGFPTKDGFWVTLEGIIEFRVKPEEASRVFVIYNESKNDEGGARIDQEIIKKVILPNARSYARLRGSNYAGRDFISGDTRTVFQADFQKELRKTCAAEGIDIIQALITKINPPQKIAEPVRQRQIALQKEKQFKKEIDQQLAEQQLATQKALVQQGQELVTAANGVIQVTTEAKQKQEVAIIEANKRLTVAQQQLEAAKDLASAVMSKGQAEADVIKFSNEAQAAGWKRSVEAFANDGNEFARWTLLKKLAPSFKSMMVNTNNSPIMQIFQDYAKSSGSKPKTPAVPAATTSPVAAHK